MNNQESGQSKDREVREIAFNPFEDTGAFFGSEDVDVEGYFNECKDLVFDRNFPTPCCLKPAQIAEYSQNGRLTGPEKDHIEACVHCRALLRMLVPNPQNLAAFQEQVIALRGAREEKYRSAESLNHSADGFPTLKYYGQYAVAAMLLSAAVYVGRYMTRSGHQIAQLKPTDISHVSPKNASESQVAQLSSKERVTGDQKANAIEQSTLGHSDHQVLSTKLAAEKADSDREVWVQDVDSRAQAGIKQAQAAADAANQTATAAGAQAQQASTTAQGAAGHVNQLDTTVSGLDQYHQVTEAEIIFRGGLPKLSDDARKQLDDLATTVNGQKGYILEVEGHSPKAGSVGIQSSERLTEAVKYYLVTEHNIPVYRLHAVALGNAIPADAASTESGAKPERAKDSTVEIRLMETIGYSADQPASLLVKPKDQEKQ
jgi:outer membrane protein OmpA-like peptidoglycan-associated protein